MQRMAVIIFIKCNGTLWSLRIFIEFAIEYYIELLWNVCTLNAIKIEIN